MYNEIYSLWICTSCYYTVTPQHLDRHLRTHHRQHPSVKTAELRQTVLTEMLKRPWIEPRKKSSRFPSPDSPPIPYLPVYSGLRCPLCLYICRLLSTLRHHLSRSHPDTRRPRGRDCHQKPDIAAAAEHVSCQRFYIAGAASQFLAITPASQTEQVQKTAQISKAEFIQSQINQVYEQNQQALAIQQQSIPIEKHSSEVSPWMELTRWPEYLRGQNLAVVAPLGSMPDSETEPLLTVFVQSVERLIHRAYTLVRGAVRVHCTHAAADSSILSIVEMYSAKSAVRTPAGMVCVVIDSPSYILSFFQYRSSYFYIYFFFFSILRLYFYFSNTKMICQYSTQQEYNLCRDVKLVVQTVNTHSTLHYHSTCLTLYLY